MEGTHICISRRKYKFSVHIERPSFRYDRNEKREDTQELKKAQKKKIRKKERSQVTNESQPGEGKTPSGPSPYTNYSFIFT